MGSLKKTADETFHICYEGSNLSLLPSLGQCINNFVMNLKWSMVTKLPMSVQLKVLSALSGEPICALLHPLEVPTVFAFE